MFQRLILIVTAAAVTIASASGSDYRRLVEPINNNIIRVTYFPENWHGNDVQISLVKDIRQDRQHTIVKKIGDKDYTITLSGTGVSEKSNGDVEFFSLQQWAIDASAPEVKNGKAKITFNIGNSTTAAFGGGERGQGGNLMGDTLVNYNRQNYGYTAGDPRISQMNITMPLFISNRGFAILFDDYAPSTFILGDPVVYETENIKRPITYYVISDYFHNGDVNALEEVTKAMSELIGRQELPPLWSLGYITSKYGYRTQAETIGVIDTLQSKGFPVDGIVLDLYWYGKEQDMGALSWEKSQWPDHRKMLSMLKQKGVNLIPISQPYVLQNGRGIDNYNYLSDRKMLGLDSVGNTRKVTIWVGEGGMLDVSNPSTRQWLRDRYRKLTDEGVAGWWGDLGEPEVHPEEMVHHNGESARLYHNRYGNDWSKIIYDLFKEEYPDRRLMTLMRGGTIGLQNYNVFPWSTDVSRSWGGLQAQIPIMVHSGLSGLGYMSHDVGGFAVDPERPVDPELYVRWLQLGTFSPILRTHAQQMAEPYKYPEYEHIILPLIKERYRWLPYNYTLAYENSYEGLPLVRPLGFSTDPEMNTCETEYMWGKDVVIAPVLQQGATSRDVILPSGRWYDYNDPLKTFVGPDTIAYNAGIDRLPMFVRAGAIIPTADYQMRNTGDYKTSVYTINYYPSETASRGYIFEDDMSTPSRGDHPYDHINIHAIPRGKELSFSISTKLFNTTLSEVKMTAKELTFRVYDSKKPVSVTDGDKTVRFDYDENKKTLSFNVTYGLCDFTTIKITY